MKVRSGFTLLVCGAVLAVGGYTLAQSGSPDTAKVREELKLQEQKLLKQFREFEEDVHRLKRRLERSDDPDDRAKAELLDQVIEKARDSSIILQFEQINTALRDNKFTNLNEVKDMLAKTGKLADDLAHLLEIYMGDPRHMKARLERERWETILKDLKAAIEWQKDVQLRTDLGKATPDELSSAQKKVIALTDTIAKNFDKVGKPGEGGEAGKGELSKGAPKPGEAKGGKAGESKPGGKENKPGEAKPGEGGKGGDPKKGGEAKPGEAKGGEPKGGEPGKGGEAKGGESKPGAEGSKGGEAKAGKGGEGASGAKGGGEKKEGGGEKGGPKDEGPKTSKKDKEGAGEAKGAEGAKSGDGEKKGGESKAGEGSKGGESKASKGGEPKGGEAKGGESKGGESKGDSKGGESSGGKGQPKPGEEGGEAGKGGSKGGGDDKKQDANGKKQVQDAADYERMAEDLIRKKKYEAASEKEGDAIKELESAKKKIEELLKQLREEELERLLAQLQARCEKMLAMQIRVYNETKAIFEVVEGRPGKKSEREDQGRSLAQSREEGEIVKEASKAIELLEAEGSAVAFPEVFQQVREDMRIVQRRLEITDVGVVTQGIESDIIDTLREMVDALKKAREENKDKKKKDDKGGGKSKDGGPQDQKLLDQIAELKMIRSMQLRINARTTTYGRLYVEKDGEQARDPHIRGELRGLSQRQVRLTEVTSRIAKGDNK